MKKRLTKKESKLLEHVAFMYDIKRRMAAIQDSEGNYYSEGFNEGYIVAMLDILEHLEIISEDESDNAFHNRTKKFNDLIY